MNTTIFKSLKFKNNSLLINNKIIFTLNEPNNEMQKYLLSDSLGKLRSAIQKSDKKYISECVNAEVVRSNDYITLTLYCENDLDRYKREYGFFMSDYSFQFIA